MAAVSTNKEDVASISIEDSHASQVHPDALNCSAMISQYFTFLPAAFLVQKAAANLLNFPRVRPHVTTQLS
jgi:hypothetical protein